MVTLSSDTPAGVLGEVGYSRELASQWLSLVAIQDESDPGSDSFSGSGIGSTQPEPRGESERA